MSSGMDSRNFTGEPVVRGGASTEPEGDTKQKDSDTIAASIVRDVFGDEGAKAFKDFFGDWF